MSQRGNILFLILLAVVLFAALAYAVTSSMRGGGQNASNENAELGAAQILQFFTAIDQAVMRMEMGGMRKEDISFGYQGVRMDGTVYTGAIHNTLCTTDKCMVFKTEGGGVAPPDLLKWLTLSPTGWSTTRLRSGLWGHMGQWPGAGTDKNDGVLYIEGVLPAVCNALKSKLGQTDNVLTSGSASDINNVPNWEVSTLVYSSSLLYGSDTAVGAIVGSGEGRSCPVYHVTMKR